MKKLPKQTIDYVILKDLNEYTKFTAWMELTGKQFPFYGNGYLNQLIPYDMYEQYIAFCVKNKISPQQDDLVETGMVPGGKHTVKRVK